VAEPIRERPFTDFTTTMTDILQALLSGLALGGVYALVALGFSITQLTTKTLNFGQGEFLMAGALVAVSALALVSGKGGAALAAVDVSIVRYAMAILVVLGSMGALGVLMFFTAVRPFVRPGAAGGGMSWIMSTIGFGILLQNAALMLWGPGTLVLPSPLGESVLRIGGAGIRAQELLVIGVSALVVVVLDHVMRRTRVGKAVRAVAANPDAASLMGIDVRAFVIGAFVLSSALAGLAGVLIAPITTASAFMGLTIALKAFSAAILGGLTSPRGCIAGGFILGLLEAGVGLWRDEWREISMFVLIILVLVLRPSGLFGRVAFEKV
jgi:branched-chain amino acid transport system permease protein